MKKTDLLAKLRQNYLELALLLAFFCFSYWLMFKTFDYQDDTILIAGKAWSDFAAHIPLIRSFSMGENLPPEYPQYPGEPIRYHYLFYFFVAMVEKLGFNIAVSMNMVSIVGMTLLLWMIYQITKLIFKKKSAAVLAVILFLFNGTFSFIELFRNGWMPLTSLLKKITQARQFLSFGPWDGKFVSAFWNWNIYTNQRHLALSFAVSLVIIWPILKYVFDKKNVINKWWILLLWMSMIFFPLLHQASYAATMIFIVLWFILNPSLFADFGFIYLIALFYSLPTFFSFETASQIKFQPWYLSEKKDILSLLIYWTHNLGLYFILFPILLIKLKINKKKLLFIFALFFVLANTFRLSTDMINNHKLLNFFMIGMNILTAGLLTRNWNKSYLHKAIVMVIIFFLTFSGLVDAFPVKNDNYHQVFDLNKRPVAAWIAANTPGDSVFLTTTYLYNPANLAGRKTFIDYGYFAWSLGYQDGQRKRLLPTLFSSEIDQVGFCDVAKKVGIDYVLISPGKGDVHNIDARESVIAKKFSPVYISPHNYKIYDINQVCNSYVKK